MTRTEISDAPPPQGPSERPAPPGQSLSHGLKQRHLSMIALGGVIGAGLFVGSGAGIAAAGPSIVLAYAASGLLVMLVMRMLGEMSAANPASGSFSVHADRALGPWAGFTAGWIYWTLLCVAIATEATAAGQIVTAWVPATQPWMWVALFMTVFCVTNLISVRNFGEAEFWFAALKIFAISAFLVLGVLAVLGLLPGTSSPGAENLTGRGGFMPMGPNGLVVGLLASVFAYGGLETVTIAAAESESPVTGVAKSVRTAMWRIGVFYVGSMLVIVTLIPWNDKSVLKGPYAAVLDYIGIPAAAQLMNVVVLVALLSAVNANIYGASRMAFSLIERGQGPRFLGRLSASGVPRPAVIASSVFGFVAVLLNFAYPTTVFQWLLNTVGAATLVVWSFIAVSQLRTRRRLEREAPERLVVRMWAFPVLTWVAIAGFVAVLVLMLTEDATRIQLAFTAGLALVLAAVGWFRQRSEPGRPESQRPAAQDAAAQDSAAQDSAAQDSAAPRPEGAAGE
jgi:L-asparagine transporter-like permease